MLKRGVTALISIAQRHSLALFVGYLLVLMLATHYPQSIITSSGAIGTDKFVHFGAYAVLTVLLLLWMHRSGSTSRPNSLAIAIGVAIAIGGLDEVTQPPFNRVSDWADWVADGLGALGGAALWLAVKRLGLLPPPGSGQASVVGGGGAEVVEVD